MRLLEQLRGGFPVIISAGDGNVQNPIDPRKGFHALVVLEAGTGFTTLNYKTNAGTSNAAAVSHFSNINAKTFEPPFVITLGNKPIIDVEVATGSVAALIYDDIESWVEFDSDIAKLITYIITALGGGLSTKFLLPLLKNIFENKNKKESETLTLVTGGLKKQVGEYKAMLIDCQRKLEDQSQTILLLTEQYSRYKAQVELVEKINEMQKKTIFSQKEDINDLRAKVLELKTVNKIDHTNGKQRDEGHSA